MPTEAHSDRNVAVRPTRRSPPFRAVFLTFRAVFFATGRDFVLLFIGIDFIGIGSRAAILVGIGIDLVGIGIAFIFGLSL